MSDSSWQQAVLREIGAAQRGFHTLKATPSGLLSGPADAAAPPAPDPQAAQPPAPPAPPQPAPQPAPEPTPQAAPAPQPMPEPTTPPPYPSPPVPQPVDPVQGDTADRQPPVPAAPFPADEQSTGYQQPVAAAPPDVVADQAVAQQAAVQQQEEAARQAAAQQAQLEAAPEQAPPLVHSDFDWAAAVNPVLNAASATGERTDQDENAAASAVPQAPGPQPHQPGNGPPIPVDQLVRRNQHGDPLARRMGRGVKKAVGGGAREAREQAAFAELMQQSVPSSRQLAIASVRGGAGKTTMAALFATELARHRGDRVLAADADAELGSLPLRLGVHSQLSLFDLAGQNPQTFEEAARFLTRTQEGLYVLSSTRSGRIAGEFSLETFQNALSKVSRYVSATVVDCGAGILTEVNRGMIATSHALVLVTPGTVDGALSARGALEWFAENNQQHVLPRTVIAMVSHAPQVGADLHRAHEMLTAWGLPVVSVPYDRHLATGSSLDLGKVSGAARTAITHIVREAFSRSLMAR
ncbi:MinD/ParA family ATP-binding protein [Actinomadura algeriensis]|uniref:MinD-like ATPase involved in chromosome partitioning or flagellar assembly n=1 Tax=Actinomadura algeriensis TaxID=1679523 RepID=A0ABR9JSP3_9ACTN|nr:MinD/ParA family protein [Actinomadura algeriensis]MBE1533371.1 MinD-like ATPase involved in chromosome partitioning or flagellar assembly [Actinomadura algeriensis]